MTTAGLWASVVASGIFHGLNPAMGWPLAVSAGLMGRSRRDLFAALGLLALGHFLAMAAMLLPFSLMMALVEWQRQIRIGAALLVIAAGVWLLVRRRHPRFIARIRPTQLALWSFAVATAHGAGLMLVPIYLGLCRAADLDRGHQAAGALIGGDLATAVAVSVVHTAAMILTGGAIALLVQGWLGLKFLSRSWFNLDTVWAVSLIVVGVASLPFAWLSAM
ncbi:hypothetical protein LJR219_004556 [Phenylobacterium sp. LjRoot219]|uniref:hypothetical protein n=1 Tax=Phenylobacterium sp. LjRoot219 TaxID=3342283 RepID=UPI003ED0B593